MQPMTRTVRGVPMRWLEAGDPDGIPLVLVHGLPTGPRLWRHVVPLLQGARVLCFELVGYADSIPFGVDRDISVARQADYLLGWLEDLGVDRAVLGGHDLGGGVVQVAAVRDRRRAAGLFLADTVAYDNWPVPLARILAVAAPVARHLPEPALSAGFRTLLTMGHDDPRRAEESLQVHLEPYVRHDGAQALVRQVESLDNRDTLAVAEGLRTLDVPARVVWGAADPFLKVASGARLAWDLRTELRRIEGALHWTPEDHPEPLAQELNELVAQVR